MKKITNLIIKGLLYSYRMDSLAFGILTEKRKKK